MTLPNATADSHGCTGKNFKKICEVRVTCPGWFNMELPNEIFFVLATIAIITIKMFFYPFLSQQLSEKHIPSSKSCNLLVLNYNWENSVKQIKIIYWRKFVTKFYLVSIAKDKDPSIRVKMHRTIFLLFTTICLIPEWMWFILHVLSFLNLLDS